MADKDKIRALLKEAKTYKKMGLFQQAKDRYVQVVEIINSMQGVANREKLIGEITHKIKEIDGTLKEIDEAPSTPELSESQINLIRKKFAFAKDKETAAFESALALAKFGQYEEALAEFRKLLKDGILPIVAAKNIITCHLTFSSPEAAIAQFSQWVSQDTLPKPQLVKLSAFIKNALEKKGIKANLPPIAKASGVSGTDDEEEEAVLDLSSIGIQIADGPLKGETVEFDIAFQSHNSVSIVVPENRKDLLDSLKSGTRLKDIQCFSPIGFFAANGIVLGRTKITEGRRKGNYTIDITVETD